MPVPAAPLSVTEDLLQRIAPSPARLWARGAAAGRHLLVTYVRAHGLDTEDPRGAVLRPDRVWVLPPQANFGAGRSPSGVDVPLPLLEEDGRQDDAVPRLAVRLTFRNGHWWVTNHSSGSATVTVSAPGAREVLGRASPPHALRRRRTIVTVPARGAGPAGPTAVEHRISLFQVWIADDFPPPPLPGARPPGGGATTGGPAAPAWSWAHQRLLAAWAYPDLIGLADHGPARGRTARLLLRQPLTGADPNERLLNGLRRRASHDLGISLAGEAGTPAFLGYVVGRRAFLAEALSALHAEYDSGHAAHDPPDPVLVPAPATAGPGDGTVPRG